MKYSYRESKEEIKNRMIHTALHFWNLKNVESLDPLIRFLIEALSEQLHNVSNEIGEIETRAMYRLSKILLPESSFMAKPAHSVAHIYPMGQDKINKDTFFATKSPFFDQEGNLQYTFYPVCNPFLHKAKVDKIISENIVYSIEPDLSKKIVHRIENYPENISKIWIGVSFENANVVDTLKNFSFYINFPNIDNRSDYLKKIGNAKWSFSQGALKVETGIFQEETEKDVLDTFFDNQNINEIINKDILHFYEKNFFTIRTDVDISQKDFSFLPNNFFYDNDLENSLLEVLDKPLLWIEISLSEYFPSTIISDIQILLNIVPIVNKQLQSLNYDLHKELGIIPLPLTQEEYFLTMSSVTDGHGRIYSPSSDFRSNTSSYNYAIRQGGTESFNTQNAKEFLVRLQNLLEDEAAVFLNLNNKEVVELIEKLLTRLQIQNTLESSFTNTQQFYVFLDRIRDSSQFFVNYWTTLGNYANDIRIGTSLKKGGENSEKVSSAILLTSTTGGTSLPNDREQIAQFKHLLSSRKRIVTNNDIKTFCLSSFPEIISQVHIEQGVGMAEFPKGGLTRTIDIYLTLSSEKVDKPLLIEQLSEQLRRYSPITFVYRIIIN